MDGLLTILYTSALNDVKRCLDLDAKLKDRYTGDKLALYNVRNQPVIDENYYAECQRVAIDILCNKADTSAAIEDIKRTVLRTDETIMIIAGLLSFAKLEMDLTELEMLLSDLRERKKDLGNMEAII